MEITEHGLIKPTNDDFYNIDDFNNNTDILEGHLKNDEIHVTSDERSGWNNKLPLAGGTITGSLVFNHNEAMRRYVDLYNYVNTTINAVGTLKIKLPKTWCSTALQLTIKGFVFTNNKSFELSLCGAPLTSSSTWETNTAKLNGDAPFSTVRLATDTDGKPIILLGSVNTVWNGLKLDITDLVASNSNYGGWETGWSASLIADETGITNIVTPTLQTPLMTNDVISTLLSKIYPIGSIYMSMNNNSPATFLGGTWSMLGEGQVLMSANPSGTTYKTSEAKGGSATTSLTTLNMPSHAHSFSGSATPSGSASTSVNISADGNHYHGPGALYATNTGLSGWIGDVGIDSNNGISTGGVFSGSPSNTLRGSTGVYNVNDYAFFNATHSHDVEGTTDWGGNHGHGASASTSLNMNNLTISGTTGAQGNGTAFSNLQPYLTTYMWKRTT